jgi:hypothetical protein
MIRARNRVCHALDQALDALDRCLGAGLARADATNGPGNQVIA